MKYTYRNIEFTEDGIFYSCSDKNLLRDVQTVFFQTKTLQSMYDRIDYFVDHRDDLLEIQELNNSAIHSTYEQQNYQLD